MANIKINSKHPLYDGMSITFKAPCDCTAVEGLTVCDEFTTKNFVFKDAHGKTLTGLGNLFSEGVYVKAVLDTGNGYAYLQNADNNSYVDQAAKVAAGVSNPNLLDNGYFGNPVNQRGQTEYTVAGYTIDRWKTNFSGDTVAITDSGIKNTTNSTSTGWHLHQIIKDTAAELAGKTIVASAFVAEYKGNRMKPIVSFRNSADGEISVLTLSNMNLGIVELSGEVPSGTVYIRVGLYASSGVAAGDYVELRAAKLELGTQQTLAHQDANGNWVLNEIPDYNEQLLRCCMSTADSSDTYANNKQTAAAVNAVPLDGSRAMTGTLNVNIGGNIGRFGVDNTNDYAYMQYAKSDGTAANLTLNPTRARYARKVAANGAWASYDILHTGNVPKPCNFVLGSYVGTGTVGASGKCSITFPFVPKYVVVSAVLGGTATAFTFTNPSTTFGVNKDTFGTFLNFHCAWSNKTLTWYIDGNSDAKGGDQLNAEGSTYRYVAWGDAF